MIPVRFRMPNWYVLPPAYEGKASYFEKESVRKTACAALAVFGALLISTSLACLVIPSIALSAGIGAVGLIACVVSYRFFKKTPSLNDPETALKWRQIIGRSIDRDHSYRLKDAQKHHPELLRLNILASEDFTRLFMYDLFNDRIFWSDLVSSYGTDFIETLSLNPEAQSKLIEKVFLDKESEVLDNHLKKVPLQKWGLSRDKAEEEFFKVAICRLNGQPSPHDAALIRQKCPRLAYGYADLKNTFGLQKIIKYTAADHNILALLRKKFLEQGAEYAALSEFAGERAFLNIPG